MFTDYLIKNLPLYYNLLFKPVLVNEQLKQLRMNMNVNGNSEDECFNLLKSQVCI